MALLRSSDAVLSNWWRAQSAIEPGSMPPLRSLRARLVATALVLQLATLAAYCVVLDSGPRTQLLEFAGLVLVVSMLAMYIVVSRLMRSVGRVAAQALRENEARFYHAVRGSRDAIWDWDLVVGRFYMSSRMREMLGYPYGKPITERDWFVGHVHEDDRERMLEAERLHREDHQPYEIEYRLRARDGSLRWTRARGQTVRDASGRATRFSGANSDITAEREATERIQALLAEERAILDNALVGIMRLKNRVIESCNHRFAEVFGYAPEELTGRSVDMLYPSAADAADGAKVYEAMREDRHCRSERLFVHRSGRLLWCEIFGAALDADDPLADSLWVLLDIDARKRAEIGLQSEKEFSEAMLAAQPGVFLVLAKSGRLVRWNRNLETVSGYAADALASIDAPAMIAPEHREKLGEAVYRTFKRGAASLAADLLTRDGRRIPQLWTGARWEAGGETYLVASAVDISEIRALNQQLEQRVAERTEELTRANRELESFSYTVSHDLSAPLRAINGFSALLVEELGGKLEPSAARLLERIVAGSLQMKALIDDLLRLAQISRTRLVAGEVDLALLARRIAGECALDTVRNPAGRSVEFRAPAALPAHGDAGLLAIALTNLIGNAWKFTARNDKALIEFGATEQDGQRVYFLRDNGAGFDMRYADKLFKPFQRLHSARDFDGTGIGLAIVHRIFERHGGRVWVESAPGAGSTFYFTLGPTTISSGAHQA